MKFLHTSDWHVGRTLNGWSLLEEQEWAFQQIVDLAISEKVDGVIIAGDLYDRAVPPVDAIKLFNKTLAPLGVGGADSCLCYQWQPRWCGTFAFWA